MQTFCQLDLEYFPFDHQKCYIQFLHTLRVKTVHQGKLISNDSISYRVGSESVSTEFLLENGEWELLDITMNNNSIIVSPFSADTTQIYPAFEIFLHLRRKSFFYLLVLVIPGSLIPLICAVGFLLPNESGEKVSLQFTAFLSFMVLQLVLIDILPSVGGRIPLIGKNN